MFDLCVGGGDIEVFGMNAKSLNLYRKERTFRRHRVSIGPPISHGDESVTSLAMPDEDSWDLSP